MEFVASHIGVRLVSLPLVPELIYDLFAIGS